MRSAVQEYLVELNKSLLPQIKANLAGKHLDTSSIRFGTLEDGEVRPLNNTRWAIPLYNVSKINSHTIKQIDEWFAPENEASFVISENAMGGSHMEIQFMPVLAQQQPQVSRVQYHPVQLEPANPSRSGGLVILMFVVVLAIAMGLGMFYLKKNFTDPSSSDDAYSSYWTPPPRAVDQFFPDACTSPSCKAAPLPPSNEKGSSPLNPPTTSSPPLPAEQQLRRQQPQPPPK